MRTLIVGLLFASSALAQPQTLRGTWQATAGAKQVYRGSWSGQMLPASSNGAQGSWTVVNDGNVVVLSGTWSAEKVAQGWQGTWSARIVIARSSRTPSGRVVSGTWQAQIDDPTLKTFAEMLERTLDKQIAGVWRSGPRAGNWWLTGARAP